MSKKINELLEKLKALLAEATDLLRATNICEWDQETNMPPEAAEGRGYISGTLQKLAHEIYTSSGMEKLLEELVPWANAQEDQDSDDVRLIQITQRIVKKKTILPAEMVAEKAALLPPANLAWREAREKNNWPLFEPHLIKIVDYMRRMVDLYGDVDHPYDVVLDDYEPGMKTAEVIKIFEAIRPAQIALIKAIAGKKPVDSSVLHKNYPVDVQLEFAKAVVTQLGYNFNRGRMDPVHHPFMITLGEGDVRITHSAKPDFFNPGLFGIMHEAGHAMYEQRIREALARTPLFSGTSLAVHESQSRMWENLVGRSEPFWKWYFPKLQEHFPENLEGVTLDQWYRAINHVKPSFIRIEADEATYNLHIMLRLELEIALLTGELEVPDLPQAWNDKFEEYFGIRPDSDTNGVLQDVHWSFGLFGYFSTYALGNLVSAQLWEVINKDIPDLKDHIQKGEFSQLLNWLTEKIYQHGSKFPPQELVKRITGEKINGDAYTRYLEEKYTKIYDL